MVRGRKPQLSMIIDNVVKCEGKTKDEIVNNLRDLYMNEVFYMKIGSNALLSVNPQRPVDSSTDEILEKYTEVALDTSNENKRKLSPHIFEMVCNAYFHMFRNKEDQSIIL
eukprot:jgi/Orpsp1_1/1178326/evm.model.c7180000064865.1